MFLARKNYPSISRNDNKRRSGGIWLSRKTWKEHYDIVWQFQWFYMDLLKVPRFPYQKRFHNKGYLNLATETLTGFSLYAFNRLCVTHEKSSNNGNLEPKSQLISLFFKVALKAIVVYSNNLREASIAFSVFSGII